MFDNPNHQIIKQLISNINFLIMLQLKQQKTNIID